jgi:hypothetical protein
MQSSLQYMLSGKKWQLGVFIGGWLGSRSMWLPELHYGTDGVYLHWLHCALYIDW